LTRERRLLQSPEKARRARFIQEGTGRENGLKDEDAAHIEPIVITQERNGIAGQIRKRA
jgi:hypothetical protein